MSDDFELVRDAVRWHEYGSQDERRKKALPALDRIEAEVAELHRIAEQATQRGMEAEAERDRLRTVLIAYGLDPDTGRYFAGTSDE